jgi:hypothetical protein
MALVLMRGKDEIGFIRKDMPLILILDTYFGLIPEGIEIVVVPVHAFDEKIFSINPESIALDYERINHTPYSLINCDDRIVDSNKLSIYELLWSSICMPNFVKGTIDITALVSEAERNLVLFQGIGNLDIYSDIFESLGQNFSLSCKEDEEDTYWEIITKDDEFIGYAHYYLPLIFIEGVNITSEFENSMLSKNITVIKVKDWDTNDFCIELKTFQDVFSDASLPYEAWSESFSASNLIFATYSCNPWD